MVKKALYILFCSLIGAIFILSGYTKLYPIEPFEFTFVDTGFINWKLAPFTARILIGLEFFIGVLFLLNFNLRKVAYKLGSFVLILFCIYLIGLILFVGNDGNCGCFGSAIEMTPLQALIKNGVMLFVIYVLHKYHDGWKLNGKGKLLTAILFLSAFAAPFILNPVELNYSEAYLNKPSENFKIELDTLYTTAKVNIPPKTLSEGKHIIAFMTLTCPHCRIAAKKMAIIQRRNPEISFYFVLNGDDDKIDPFFDETDSRAIPHCFLPGRSFIYLAGTGFPTIYMINNSIVEHQINYMNMDQAEIEKWLEQPQ